MPLFGPKGKKHNASLSCLLVHGDPWPLTDFDDIQLDTVQKATYATRCEKG